ncbi:hypothetical protein [Sandarakinorhabdus sp. DWP1-3-1]|uniref:hypothetical protein n=1 Tax=Sandarakinorhabdus sp. DWP1-3-1 TaxID=2804627 RepID=UPI003CF8732B
MTVQMAPRRRFTVRLFHKIHLWIGVVVGIQLLLWTASGLLMTSFAIEEVRGTTLRRDVPAVDLRAFRLAPMPRSDRPIERAELIALLGRPAYRMAAGERRWLIDARDGQNWTIGRGDALAIAGNEVKLRPPLVAMPVADPPPLELRRPGAAWRVDDADGTHVYIGTAGEVMAVRTDLWRWFDFAWGLHILDPLGREDTHHPFLIASAALSLVSVSSGFVLLWVRFRPRRRRA